MKDDSNHSLSLIHWRFFVNSLFRKRSFGFRRQQPIRFRAGELSRRTKGTAPVSTQWKRSLGPGEPGSETVRTVVENLIRLVKAEIDADAVLVAAADVFEVPNVPRLILQGPTLENDDRRTMAHVG